MIAREILIIFITVTIFSFAKAGDEITAPTGWRVPILNDFPNLDRMALDTTKISRDFNGDGKPDKVITLIYKKNKNVFGLFAYYDGIPEPEKINKKPIPSIEYHLYSLNPGQYHLPKYSQTVVMKYGGFIRQEIEYGYGTIYWFTKKGWKYEFATGEPLRKILKKSNKT